VKAKGTVGFKAALSLFKKLEEINPGRPGKDFVRLRDTSSMLERQKWNNEKPKAPPVNKREKVKSKIVAKVRVTKHKQRLLNPILKDYVMITKSSANPRNWAYRYGYKFFACLGALPTTTNTNANEPVWVKAKKMGELRPCLFWFENKGKYNTLKAKVGKMNVRSVEFQKTFAELALGIIVLAHESAVSNREKRALHQLKHITERDITLRCDAFEFKDEHIDIKKEFAIVTKSHENEEFESHKFRADSEEKRDKWMSSIRTMLRRRLHSIGGENLGRTIARMRKNSVYSFSSNLDQPFANRSPRGIRVSPMRPTFSKPMYSTQWSNTSLPSKPIQEDKIKVARPRHRKFKSVSIRVCNQVTL
jgi:hypothetical protein